MPRRGRGRGRGHWRGRGRGRGKPTYPPHGGPGEESVETSSYTPEGEEENSHIPGILDGSLPTGKQPEAMEVNEKEGDPDEHGEVEEGFLKEADVGITEYISSLPGFNAIIKQRYSDFIVNEIDEEGQTVKLTHLEVDQSLLQADDEEDGPELDGVLSHEQKEKLDDFNSNPVQERTLDFCAPEDKVMRAKMHQIVRVRYKSLESDTLFENDVRFIRIMAKGAKGAGSRHFYGRRNIQHRSWPRGCGNYCKFVLYKENMDTIEAVYRLTKFFHINKNMFQFAGTKDKRAITSQEFTVYRVKAERLVSANRYFYKMALGNFRYVDQPLKLGQLSGNRFTIILRDVTGSDELINTSLESLKTKGFINYFGMQRFGSTAIPTYQVGKELLKSNYKEAAELILQPRPGEKESIAECRKSWWKDKNCMQMLTALPRKYNIERTLLEGLIKFGESNYANAFQMIHRNTRMLYLHGYQSYIWNSVASRRLREFGMVPIVGDLVYKGNMKDVAFKEESSANGTAPDGPTSSRMTPAVVTTETKSQYTIHDVLLPLPGYDVKYPDNEVGKWYTDLLAADGLTMEGLKHSNKQYALPGAYRRLIILPTGLEWKTYQYTDVTKELTISDLDLIQQKPEPVSEPDGTTKALKLEMCLQQSCYATMALREILKIDTSAAYQSTLNHGVMPDRTPTAIVVKEMQSKQQTNQTG
ncbi:pseudouridylate synthase 7 homolog [Ostrea edulis]|uniref:pseudouridylate synthase 7 homolog n=1 Tax=Ostrea edulis TaxID=37623 RepID=UPI002094095A|nr:pseudouridylate synthase 7 homolog [Ostrea edulis]XP_048740935.1 pseudouridylate synthase 7 homolog [Ostrea edulis]